MTAAAGATRTNRHGQPVGDPVDWVPARPPQPVALVGRLVRLEPALDHVPGLYAALCGEGDDALWTYLFQERPRTAETLGREIAAAAAAPGTVPFAILVDGQARGLASLMRADPAHGSIEVGGICLSRRLQRTREATEAFAVLARHVFDDLGNRRYEWKCDSLNAPSRRAALRLGFTEEGTFRNAVVYKGRNRDTTWFSITDEEWPRVRAGFEAWLADDNVDGDGRQRRSLAEVRGTL